MNIFPENTNKVLKNIAYVVITISIIYSISNGILHALVNGLIWWFVFWILAKISNPGKKTNTSDVDLNNSEDQEIDKKQPSEKKNSKKIDYSKPSKDFDNFIMVIGIFVGLLIVGYFVLLGFSSKSDDGSMPLVDLERCLNENITFYTAEDILKQYESNPYRTSKNLKNSCIRVESTITEIANDNNFVTFETKLSSSSLNFVKFTCSNLKEEHMMKINIGDNISVVGESYLSPKKNENFGFLYLPLRNCKIQS